MLVYMHKTIIVCDNMGYVRSWSVSFAAPRTTVRILSESMTGPIDMDNLEIAKEVLRRKFIIGLLDNKRGSFARFDHYFKWKDR